MAPVVKGWCTSCYADVYRREVQVSVPKPSTALTQEDLTAPVAPTVSQVYYIYSLTPYGPTIQYCPFCGTMY